MTLIECIHLLGGASYASELSKLEREKITSIKMDSMAREPIFDIYRFDEDFFILYSYYRHDKII